MQNDDLEHRAATYRSLLVEQDQGEILFPTQNERMRWFVLICLMLAFLASIIVVIVTKNPLTLSATGSLLLAMRPIIRWLFPQGRAEQANKKQEY